ncbi:mitochondrial carrier domain-containing protein [Colletotrichum acutatum]|uniref:Mitochondrial carrier domain-containing protein n=1 Tax=Glomerella acutata TaxID=27357 RepID=A0AAD8UHJ0_GLOAC|nr:mitochondrial carrier domain-containing protein [Colletotrichum acutatum]KAK1719345.1 mitochondrial carrier domain-containing protein [Colletotrichum acutatum]
MASITSTASPGGAVLTTTPPDKKSKLAIKHIISPGISLISGGIAGAVEAATTYPFEFAKTRAQLHSAVSKNPFAVLLQVARQDGPRAIYTGCSTLIIGTTFKAGVRFLSFDSIRNSLMDSEGRLTPVRGILAGMIAGCVESIVAVTPTERVKTALIDDAKSGARKYASGTNALVTMVKKHGFAEIYRGLVSTTLKQSTTSAVRMGSYNVLREQSKQHGLPNNSLVTFGSGSVAGIVTVYATQPFDTIKTRAQSARGAGTLEAFRMVLSERGLRGFWSGSTMRLGRLILSGGIVFTVYEKVSGLLSR